MTIVSIILLAACSAAFCVLMHLRVCAIKRKFRVNLATFDRLEEQFQAKCKAYNELAACVASTPLPDRRFRYLICKECARAYLNDAHICNEVDCLPPDKVNRDEMHEYEGFIPVRHAVMFYMAHRTMPIIEHVVHRKTGNKYTVLCDAALDCTNSRDGTEVMIYTRDGKIFVREKQEFMKKFVREKQEFMKKFVLREVSND